jgi:hypothetical protein
MNKQKYFFAIICNLYEKPIDLVIDKILNFSQFTEFITKKLKLDKKIESIKFIKEGKEIYIIDDMGLKILFNYISKNNNYQILEINCSEVYRKKENINYNIENEELNFEDKLEYQLIELKETIMKELLSNLKNIKYRKKKCSKCNKPIIGFLYQCSECEIFFLCQNCMEKNLEKETKFHDHKFYIL